MTYYDRLSQSINDKFQPVATRRAAVIEIAEIGGAEALTLILQALTDEAPGVRREAAIALQKYNSPDVTTALLDAIKNEDNDLTLWTHIEVLGNIGSLTALPALQDLMTTTLSPLTRRVIEKSIDQITSKLPNNISDEQDPSQEIEDEKPRGNERPNPTNIESELPTENQGVQDEHIVEVVDEHESTQQILDEGIDDKIEINQDEEEQVSGVETDSDIDVDNEQELLTEETQESSNEENEERAESNKEPAKESLQDLESKEIGKPMSGSSPALPVLVPNTSVVIYESEEQLFQPGVFDLVLRPTAYLSKRWVSRTRLYLVLLSLLAAATFTLVFSQVQRRPRSPYRPNAAIAYMENPEKYLNAGSFFIQQEDYHSAIETLEFLRGVDSIRIELYRHLGYAYFQANQYALATESYEYYLKSRENKTYEPFVAEAAYQQNGDDKIDDSSDYMTHNLLGTSYKQLGNFHKARQVFEEAIKLAPFEAEAYSNLAQLYTDGFQQKHKLSEALAYTAVSINPDMSPYHDTLGWIHVKNGRLHKGTNTLKQAIRLQSDYIPAHYHLSEVAQKSKDFDSAINVVKNDLIEKLRPTSNLQSDMIEVLTYIYETESHNIPRYNTSFLHHRSLRR